jgi:hypothetical protein
MSASKRKKRSDDVTSAILVLEGGKDVENIWLKKVRGNQYEVRTVPFWAYNMSMGDVVEAGPDEDGEGLFVKKVTKRSGNRTVRVAFKVGTGVKHPEGKKLESYFKKEGLDYEVFEPAMFSVNVPSKEEYERLVERLKLVPKQAKMIWEDGDPQPNRNLDASDAKGRKPRKD